METPEKPPALQMIEDVIQRAATMRVSLRELCDLSEVPQTTLNRWRRREVAEPHPGRAKRFADRMNAELDKIKRQISAI